MKAEIDAFGLDYICKVFPVIFPSEKFNLFTEAEKCVYCEITIPMVVELANKQQLYMKNYLGWSLEVDRIDSNKEYSPENYVKDCYWCNNAKTDEFTFEEFKEVGISIEKIWKIRLAAK